MHAEALVSELQSELQSKCKAWCRYYSDRLNERKVLKQIIRGIVKEHDHDQFLLGDITMFKQNTHATKLARAYHTLQQTWSIYVVVGSLLLSAAPVFLAGFQPENDPPWPTTIAFSSRPLNIPYKQVG